MADNDDIIILEENGETPKKKHVTVGSSIENQPAKELCIFQREIITEHDYKKLADEEFLNENIINFYLMWLYEKLSDEHKSMIHIYSSYFYFRLISKPSKKNKDETKTRAEQEYERVKSWTKEIDIFEKRMLIIPICEHYHWYLVIVCNPQNNPFIMVLDSLGRKHPTTVAKIKSYLMMEHLEKLKFPSNFGKDKIGEKHPTIPYQKNGFDCGPYLLHYVELIFRDPDLFLGSISPDLSKWFNTSDVEYKREDIANLIKEIASKDKTRKVKFPKIKMASREKTSKSKAHELDAKIREKSVKSFKSDKMKSFDMFEAAFKSSPVKKKPKMISDVHLADESAREGSSNRFMLDEMPSKTLADTKLAYDCTICKVECKTPERLYNHLQGKKHKKILALSNTQTQSQFYCKICNVNCNSEVPFKLHLAGTKHQNKVSASTMA